MIADGFDPLFVQQQVGHRWGSTTTHYTGVTGEYRNRVLRRALDQALASPATEEGRQHQHPKSLMSRLNALGITTRVSRNTAMLHLASTVPPAVFASLIGISIGAATRWAEHAGGTWTDYVAASRHTSGWRNYTVAWAEVSSIHSTSCHTRPFGSAN